MKRILFVLMIAFSLSACTTLGDNLGTHENLASAIKADVGTTALTQLLTHRTELNPLVVGCAKMLGIAGPPGIIICSIAAGIAAYHVITYIDNQQLTAAATVIEVGMAARNLYVFGH